MYLPKIIETISKKLQEHNAKAIIVGGSVRDHFLKLPIKDYDIEVYGLNTIEELETILSKFGSVNLVGKSFGVLKFVHEKEEYDFSFPRLESKVGKGHRGFDVETDGSMAFEEAALRHLVGEDLILDPFGGSEVVPVDLASNILFPVEGGVGSWSVAGVVELLEARVPRHCLLRLDQVRPHSLRWRIYVHRHADFHRLTPPLIDDSLTS